MFIMVISASIRCGVEQWQLVGLITRRSQVQVLPPLLTGEGHVKTMVFVFKVCTLHSKPCPRYYKKTTRFVVFFVLTTTCNLERC